MDLSLSEEQQLLLKNVREFCEKELAPRVPEYEESGQFPWDIVHKLGETGILGTYMPEEYGGAGADTLTHMLIVEQLAKYGFTAASLYLLPAQMVHYVYRFGSKEQKAKVIPGIVAGRELACLGLNEPNGGSDVAGMQSTAVLDGNEWVINGEKCFITLAGEAHWNFVFAKTDPAAGHKGISCFLVETGTPGFDPSHQEKKMAFDALPNRTIKMTNVRVPKESLVGQLNHAFYDVMTILDFERVGVGAGALGAAEASMEAAVEWAKQRVVFGQPIANFEGIQFMIADMARDIELMRSLLWRCCWMEDQGIRYSKEASALKIFSSESNTRIVGDAVQIYGGLGICKSSPVERFYREAKPNEIGGGTNQIQRTVLAREVIGTGSASKPKVKA